MRLFCYYALHTFKNQIRKLFHTWVAVFLLVCFAFGLLVGFGAVLIEDMVEANTEEGTVEAGDPEMSEMEETVTEEAESLAPETVEKIATAAAGVVVLLLLTVFILSAGKSGSRIFPMADVNLLFPAPMKPQSVLLFRLTTQMGATLFVGFYLLLQLPTLADMGVRPGASVLLILAFVLALCYGRLVNLLLFTAASTQPWVRKAIPLLGYGLPLLCVGGFALYYRLSGLGLADAFLSFFASSVGRYIPVYGWLQGFCSAALGGRWLSLLVYFVLLATGIALLSFLIWHMRVDFYEDALEHSSRQAEQLAAAGNESGILQRQKKDRSERLRRDGLRHGQGASTIFFRTMYNRFRFAPLGFLTKTTVTYLVISVGLCIFLRLVVGISHTLSAVIPLCLGGFAFFRSLGNPIAGEISKVPFLMMPESATGKIWVCLLTGSCECALDVAPALLAACLLLGANPLPALAWLIFILSVDLYSSAVGAFIDLSLSVGLSKTVRSLVQILFVYFGLLPDIVLLLVGGILSQMPLFALMAAVLNLALGVGFGFLCPLFLARGRR